MADKNRRNVVIGDKIWSRLKVLAKAEEQSMSSLIREALHQFLMEREKRSKIYDPVKDELR